MHTTLYEHEKATKIQKQQKSQIETQIFSKFIRVKDISDDLQYKGLRVANLEWKMPRNDRIEIESNYELIMELKNDKEDDSSDKQSQQKQTQPEVEGTTIYSQEDSAKSNSE